jgi:hypothetical protein
MKFRMWFRARRTKIKLKSATNHSEALGCLSTACGRSVGLNARILVSASRRRRSSALIEIRIDRSLDVAVR